MRGFGDAARRCLPFVAFVLLPLVYRGPEFVETVRAGYFNDDDVQNMYWGATTGYDALLLAHLNPASSVFRPAGLLWYRLIGQLFGVNPVPFHLVQSVLNILNAVLVYAFVRQLSRSHFAAALASSLWVSSLALHEAIWWFGSIFDILSTTYLLAALLLFASSARSAVRLPGILLLFMLAFRSKESAVVLPALLAAYALFVHTFDRNFWLTRWADLLSTTFLGMVFFSFRYSVMATPNNPSAEYYFDFTLRALVKNGAWYLRELVPGQKGAAESVLALCVLLAVVATIALRDRLLWYALAFACVAMLPAIFLSNHPYAFYWYLPSVGIWFWVGRLVVRVRDRLTPVLDWRRRALAGLLFVVVFAGAVLPCAQQRAWALEDTRKRGGQLLAAVERIKRLPAPDAAGVLVVERAPRAFNADGVGKLYYLLHGVRPREVRIVSFSD